jgi:hypothetical protein
MILKEKWGSRVWEVEDTVDLIKGSVSFEAEYRLEQLTEIIARMIDRMGLSDQEKFDLIDPHSAWEIAE